MEKFLRWLWEPLNLLSQALNWIYSHPKGAIAIALLAALPIRCCLSYPAACAPSRTEQPVPETRPQGMVAPQRRLPPPPAPKNYANDPGAAIRDLETVEN